MRISEWSSDVCSSGLEAGRTGQLGHRALLVAVALGAHEVLGVHDADDVVDPLAACRDAAVAVEDHDLHGVGDAELGGDGDHVGPGHHDLRSEEHTSELQSLMRISYAGFCLKKKK